MGKMFSRSISFPNPETVQRNYSELWDQNSLLVLQWLFKLKIKEIIKFQFLLPSDQAVGKMQNCGMWNAEWKLWKGAVERWVKCGNLPYVGGRMSTGCG